MNYTIEVEEISAHVCKRRMDERGVTVEQMLKSMQPVTMDGKTYIITKLIDINSGLEIT